MGFTTLFWIAAAAFFVLSAVLLVRPTNTLLPLQVASGATMFATSKLGRAFLGLE
jgi:hypothetical protein